MVYGFASVDKTNLYYQIIQIHDKSYAIKEVVSKFQEHLAPSA
jgi:hypothetical protein